MFRVPSLFAVAGSPVGALLLAVPLRTGAIDGPIGSWLPAVSRFLIVFLAPSFPTAAVVGCEPVWSHNVVGGLSLPTGYVDVSISPLPVGAVGFELVDSVFISAPPLPTVEEG